MLAHTTGFLEPLTTSKHFGERVHAFLIALQPLGVLGVELFFVLSGFLIGNILIHTFMSAEKFAFSDIRNFWVRRWFRTLPVYWLVLTTVIGLFWAMQLHKPLGFEVLFYPFLQNLVTPHPPYFFGEAWSLSVEEWSYLLLPVFLLVASRLFPPTDKAKFLFRVFALFLALFIVVRLVNAFHPMYGADADAGIRKVVIFRLDAIIYGVLFAHFHYFKPLQLYKWKYLLLLAGLAGVGFCYYLLQKPGLVIMSDNNHLKFLGDAFFYMLLPLSFSLVLPFANSVKRVGSRVFTNVVQYISKISYAMYLSHYSLIYIAFFYNRKIASHYQLVLAYMAYLLILFTVSSLLYTYFERPFMHYRDKITVAK